MTIRLTDDDLRSAWRATERTSPEAGGCLSVEEIWKAVHGELDRDDLRRALDHAARCGPCAEAWRIAADVGGAEAVPLATAEPLTEARERPARSDAPRRWWVGLAAALVALGFGLGLYQWRQTQPSVYRTGESSAIRSLIADGSALPRDAFELRWQGPPDAVEYDLRLTTGDLLLVDVRHGLREAHHQVPSGALARLPDGTPLYWQVEATIEGGDSEMSPTFAVEIAPARSP